MSHSIRMLSVYALNAVILCLRTPRRQRESLHTEYGQLNALAWQ